MTNSTRKYKSSKPRHIRKSKSRKSKSRKSKRPSRNSKRRKVMVGRGQSENQHQETVKNIEQASKLMGKYYFFQIIQLEEKKRDKIITPRMLILDGMTETYKDKLKEFKNYYKKYKNYVWYFYEKDFYIENQRQYGKKSDQEISGEQSDEFQNQNESDEFQNQNESEAFPNESDESEA